MTDAAIIAGSLVDVRNVGTHKSVKLTVHVPEEHARKIFDAFGWPTGAKPVAVAVARLSEGKDDNASSSSGDIRGLHVHDDNHARDDREASGSIAQPRPDQSVGVPAGADKKSPAQIAGYLCTIISFQKFLKHKCPSYWAKAINETADRDDVEDWGTEAAAQVVRDYCQVSSRSEITPQNGRWSEILLAYRLWEKEAEVVPA